VGVGTVTVGTVTVGIVMSDTDVVSVEVSAGEPDPEARSAEAAGSPRPVMTAATTDAASAI
jgi:hypothetical protein